METKSRFVHRQWKAQNISPKRALFEYACRILTRRRYTVAEMRKKLEQRQALQTLRAGTDGNELSAIEAVLARLQELKFLDDPEYVKLFMEDQLRRKPQGIRLLQKKLQLKGVAQDLIQNTFKAQPPDELELAREALQKKLRTLKNLPPQKRKEKLYRFLASRGFEIEVILQVLKI